MTRSRAAERTEPDDAPSSRGEMMASTRASYDAVASAYADAFMDELENRPIERGLLDCFVSICSERAGLVADVGCGPGHVTRYLSDRGVEVMGLDLSPAMVEEARRRNPDLEFRVGTMTDLEEQDGGWAAAVVLYSIIHLSPRDRESALREFARVIQPGGALLISFHVSTEEQPSGTAIHLETWFDQPVDITGFFLAPETVIATLADVGFEVVVRLERQSLADDEYPSRRCYLLASRVEGVTRRARGDLDRE